MNTEKVLVAYFSKKGAEETSNSAKLANKAGELLKAKGVDFETFAIVPTEYYPEDEEEMKMATQSELRLHARPALVGKYSGMRYVERILLVVPNWWNALPAPVMTFLDEYDFNNKRIVPVVTTSEDSDEAIIKELRKVLPKTWILPGVEVKGDGGADAETLLNKAIDQLFMKQDANTEDYRG